MSMSTSDREIKLNKTILIWYYTFMNSCKLPELGHQGLTISSEANASRKHPKLSESEYRTQDTKSNIKCTPVSNRPTTFAPISPVKLIASTHKGRAEEWSHKRVRNVETANIRSCWLVKSQKVFKVNCAIVYRARLASPSWSSCVAWTGKLDPYSCNCAVGLRSTFSFILLKRDLTDVVSLPFLPGWLDTGW